MVYVYIYTCIFECCRYNWHLSQTLYSSGTYPTQLPRIVLPSHLQSLGLKEHILSGIPEGSEGSPVLYQLIDAAREWADNHPMCMDPEQAKRSSNASTSNGEEKAKNPPICKFFLQGKCRFGDKCKFYHGKSGAAVTRPKNQKAAVEDDELSSKERQVGGGGRKSKAKSKPTQEELGRDETEKKVPMRTSDEVISRILWDPDLPSEEFKIGYLDRFVGIMEKPFSAFSWEDIATVGINVLAIPKHRIQYFKYREEIVWDKRSQVDNFFGSRGGRVIQDIIAEQQQSRNDQKQDDKEASGSEAASASQDESKQVEAELIEVDMEEEVSEEEGAASGPRPYRNDRNRPTHFACLRITNDQVKENVGKIQSHITKITPQLAEGCLPITTLHVTLCMIRLENEHQIAIAQEVMENARAQFIHILPRCLQLSFTGVSNFRERLVYVNVAPCPALEKFVFFLLERFQEAGLRTPGNHKEYTPHMTIVKLSRPMQRELHTDVISSACYQPFLNVDIGSNHVESLFLCSTTGPKQADGFYDRLSIISNSLSGLPAHFLSLLEKRLNFFGMSGVITEHDRDQLSKSLQAATGQQGAVCEFDAAIEEIARLGSEETMCSSDLVTTQVPVAITLRGVPGSGKSFLATHCSEYLNDFTKVAICSADSFFIESSGYKFSPKRLPKSHTHCLELFLQALDEGKELVIVDNTNSKRWEYSIYAYLSSILGCKFYILEVPCPSKRVLETFRSRNQHSVDSTAALKIFERWEVDDRASLVPPSLAYPRMIPTSLPLYSLISLCLPEGTEIEQALGKLTTIKAIYSAVFLTTESQWQLVTALAPTHPRISAEHVTLCFEPGKQACLAANIGRKVTVRVTGSTDNGKIQVATVELPHRVASQNSYPHVTVSTEENISPKMANEMLQRQAAKPLYLPLELEGVIGLMVRDKNELDEAPKDAASKEEVHKEKNDLGNQPTFAIRSETDFQTHVLPKLADSPDDNEASALSSCEIDTSVQICTGKQKITKLYVFDFDGTLFDTPDPRKGRQLYESYTGKKWERRGWLGWPESLLPPMKIRPGPALSVYMQHSGQAGSLTVVLTGRIERTKTGVTQVLENFKAYPEQLIMKPDAIDETTPVFKSRIIQQMLEKYPDVSLVKFWDDIPANLAAIHRLSKSAHKYIQFEVIDAIKMLPTTANKRGKKLVVQPPLCGASSQLEPTSSSSFLENYLASCGCLPNKAYTSAAMFGMRFIAEQFCKILGFWGDPMHLVYPFGSFPLGRKGDIDVCFLAPPHFTPTDCLEHLWRQLGECGVNYLHKGYSVRCPRLKVMLEFPSCPPIDYDIVFAVTGDSTFFDSLQSAQVPSPKAFSLVKPKDTASKTALTGAVLLHNILEEINRASVTTSQFGAVVEMVVQVFSAQRQKGNAYHCIRTFHIVRLLAEFIKTYTASPENANCDLLFKNFVSHAAKVTDDQWKKLFGEFVPPEFIPKVRKVFELAARETAHDEDPSLICYEELLDRGAPYPPAGYTTVELSLSGTNKVALWKLHAIVEARLPSYIRQLISSGLDVLPDGNTQNERKFGFVVPHTKSTKQTLQQVLRPFWNEIADFRKESGVGINLNFGQASSDAGTTPGQIDQKQISSSPAIDQIKQFVSDAKSDELKISQHLNSYDRMLVYETCERLGLNHATVDNGKEKYIVIKKN